MRTIEQSDLREDELDRLIHTVTTPRPIAWVSTRGTDGVDNLAPFSYYNNVSSVPPVVMFSGRNRGNGELKDTVRNSLKTGEFVVNVVTDPLIEEMDQTSAERPPEDSEFEYAGVTPVESTVVSPPRVGEAAIALECCLYDHQPVYDYTMVLGEVEVFHVDDDLFTDGKIDMRNLNTVARLGGPYYSRIDRINHTREF